MTEIACARRKPSLRKMPRWFGAQRAEANLAQQLVRPQDACAEARVEVAPAAARARRPRREAQHDLGAERDQRGDRVVGGRGGDEVAGDGGARANLRRADLHARLRQRQTRRARRAPPARRCAWPARRARSSRQRPRTYFSSRSAGDVDQRRGGLTPRCSSTSTSVPTGHDARDLPRAPRARRAPHRARLAG